MFNNINSFEKVIIHKSLSVKIILIIGLQKKKLLNDRKMSGAKV